MSQTGITAYRTFLGLSLHFRRGSYDGWIYNFNGKVKPETFEANKGIVYQYAAIETKFPNKNDQLRYFYPAFKKFGYCKASDIRAFGIAYTEFNNKFANLVEMDYGIELRNAASKVSSINHLIGLDGELPFLYNCYIEELISYDSLVILSLAIPEINTIVSKEPFLWNSLVEKLKFDSRFYNLYFNEENSIKQLKQNTIAILSDVWKLNKAGK